MNLVFIVSVLFAAAASCFGKDGPKQTVQPLLEPFHSSPLGKIPYSNVTLPCTFPALSNLTVARFTVPEPGGVVSVLVEPYNSSYPQSQGNENAILSDPHAGCVAAPNEDITAPDYCGISTTRPTARRWYWGFLKPKFTWTYVNIWDCAGCGQKVSLDFTPAQFIPDDPHHTTNFAIGPFFPHNDVDMTFVRYFYTPTLSDSRYLVISMNPDANSPVTVLISRDGFPTTENYDLACTSQTECALLGGEMYYFQVLGSSRAPGIVQVSLTLVHIDIPDTDNGLTTGEIVGIAGGCAVGVGIIVVLVIFMMQKRGRSRHARGFRRATYTTFGSTNEL